MLILHKKSALQECYSILLLLYSICLPNQIKAAHIGCLELKFEDLVLLKQDTHHVADRTGCIVNCLLKA